MNDMAGEVRAASVRQRNPVRAILFDKRPESNWTLGWHQDRTIAVCARVETKGFGPWSVKAGILHVEPPFALIERMITLRAHLDDCGEDNAPLLIVPGSHRLGRVPANEVSALAARCGSLPCLAKAGDIWLNATAIVHASKAAMRPARRRVLQVDYSADELPNGLRWLGV
ncbi:MAG: phytanoyl-CoA dioxygenase [Alphaproteobacteria bacterium]|nr:phytanoyl-CoA dioxygenase [Alphaproteobacteria bacterium]